MEGCTKLLESINVEFVRLHKPLLFGAKSAFEEAFERRISRRPEEEGVAGNAVDRRHVVANGFHHIPRELPKRQPHESGRLGHQKAEAAPQLPSYQCFCLPVYLHLHLLQPLQLFPSRIIRFGYRQRNRILNCPHNLKSKHEYKFNLI